MLDISNGDHQGAGCNVRFVQPPQLKPRTSAGGEEHTRTSSHVNVLCYMEHISKDHHSRRSAHGVNVFSSDAHVLTRYRNLNLQSAFLRAIAYAFYGVRLSTR